MPRRFFLSARSRFGEGSPASSINAVPPAVVQAHAELKKNERSGLAARGALGDFAYGFFFMSMCLSLPYAFHSLIEILPSLSVSMPVKLWTRPGEPVSSSLVR